jgi:integrase
MPIYKLDKKRDGLQGYKIIVSYTFNGEHKQKSKTVYGLTEARRAESELIAQTKAPPSRMTVKDLSERFLAIKKLDIKQKTLVNYESILSTAILPILGETRLDALNIQALEAWKLEIDSKPYTHGTKEEARRVLSTLLNYAVTADFIPANPVKKLKPFKDDFPPEPLHYYTAEQFLKYISAARSRAETSGDFRFFVFFSIAFYTGMRKGEINALKWTDLSGNIIHVTRSISQHVKKQTIEGKPKSKAAVRDLQIPQPLLQILQTQKARQKQAPVFSEDFRICGGQDIIPDQSLQTQHEKIIKDANLPPIKIHDFRHSHASLLINNGISIQEIARRLGHKDVQLTWKVYAHLYPREEDRAITILNRVKNQE